jgi:hypothetical protein
MKIIYVCSPLRGDYETNIAQAKQYCRAIALGGNIPIAPHVYCTAFLDDTVPDERKAGMAIGIELLRFCDELMVCGDIISEGMAAEIAEAKRLGIPVINA